MGADTLGVGDELAGQGVGGVDGRGWGVRVTGRVGGGRNEDTLFRGWR